MASGPITSWQIDGKKVETVSFNFMAAVIICSDFRAQEEEICHYFQLFPLYFPK